MPKHITTSKANLISLCFLGGITWETFHISKYLLQITLAIIIVTIFIWLFISKKILSILTFVLSFYLGLLYVNLWRHYYLTPIDKLPREERMYEGVIIADPDIRADKILLKIKVHDPPVSIQISVPKYPTYSYGDKISFQGRIQPAEPFNGFNYPLYLARFKISGVIQRPKKIKLIDRHCANPFILKLYELKHLTEAAFNRNLPEPEASFVAGVLIGSKRSIPEEVSTSLQKTGTSHLVAISGANITICLSILLAVFPGLRARSRLILVVISAIFITVFTGASASVIRGACVAILSSYLHYRQRRAWPYNFIIFTLTILILFNPLLLWADPGFQLSIGAFFGLVIINPILQNGWLKITRQTVIQSSTLKVFFETLSAYVGTLPICLYYFKRAPLLGLLVNPLVLWIIPHLTIWSFLLLFLSFLPKFLLFFIATPTWFIAKSILKIITICGQI